MSFLLVFLVGLSCRPPVGVLRLKRLFPNALLSAFSRPFNSHFFLRLSSVCKKFGSARVFFFSTFRNAKKLRLALVSPNLYVVCSPPDTTQELTLRWWGERTFSRRLGRRNRVGRGWNRHEICRWLIRRFPRLERMTVAPIKSLPKTPLQE